MVTLFSDSSLVLACASEKPKNNSFKLVGEKVFFFRKIQFLVIFMTFMDKKKLDSTPIYCVNSRYGIDFFCVEESALRPIQSESRDVRLCAVSGV